MNNRIKTRKLFSIKLSSIILLTTLFLSSCEQNSNKNERLNVKFIEIYKMDIKMKLADLQELTYMNPAKYKGPYYEIKKIQRKFDSIYSHVERNDLNINALLKEIYDQTKKNYRYDTANKLEIILNTNKTKLDKKELQSALLEINSTIISQLRDNIDYTDLKFNKIAVIVIPDEKVIKLGDTYKARVVIAGVDTTSPPSITYKDQSNQMKSIHGLLQIKGEKRGMYKSTGVVDLKANESRITKRFTFDFEFEVK